MDNIRRYKCLGNYKFTSPRGGHNVRHISTTDSLAENKTADDYHPCPLVYLFIRGALVAFALNAFTFMGFPLGFYMAAQGSEIIFVIIIFWFAWAQHRIDRETGFAEEG